ncbi:MAG: hypothetical protein L6Q95_04910 [Planctomycetes bacterium]|nr:hypothetical protein [Planctomycetota bacterium]
MIRRGLLLLALGSAAASADESKPLPLAKSVILPSGGTYHVEGRQEIVQGQELSIQKGTLLQGQGENAVLVVSGALQVRGIFGSPVKIENLTIELSEKCERLHLESVEMRTCTIRTPEGKACEARVHLEEAILDGVPLDLRLRKGEVTILNSRTKGPVKIVAVPEEGKAQAPVEAFVNACNVDRDFHAEGLLSMVMRACLISGNAIAFKDCETLTFDANIAKGPSILFEQSKAGGFKKTIVQKTDFHGCKLVLKAPRDGAKKDNIPVDKCWFQGRTKKDEILGRDIQDGHTDEKTGAYVVFRKINERELMLGGMTTQRGSPGSNK